MVLVADGRAGRALRWRDPGVLRAAAQSTSGGRGPREQGEGALAAAATLAAGAHRLAQLDVILGAEGFGLGQQLSEWGPSSTLAGLLRLADAKRLQAGAIDEPAPKAEQR